MINSPTNLGISVANLGVANLDRMNNPRPSEARVNNLSSKLVSAPCNNPPTVQTPDNMDHPAPEDHSLLGETWTSTPSHRFRFLFFDALRNGWDLHTRKGAGGGGERGEQCSFNSYRMRTVLSMIFFFFEKKV